MSDFEIEEIRRVRKHISAEHGHDLQRIAEHYRELEEKLRKSGQFKFADELRYLQGSNSERPQE